MHENRFLGVAMLDPLSPPPDRPPVRLRTMQSPEQPWEHDCGRILTGLRHFFEYAPMGSGWGKDGYLAVKATLAEDAPDVTARAHAIELYGLAVARRTLMQHPGWRVGQLYDAVRTALEPIALSAGPVPPPPPAGLSGEEFSLALAELQQIGHCFDALIDPDQYPSLPA